MCRGKSLRSAKRLWGDTARSDVRAANCVVLRCLVLIKLLTLRSVLWVCEQPLASCMYRLPPFWSYLMSRPRIAGIACVRRFIWIGHWGGPIPKPIELYGISSFLNSLVSKRPEFNKSGSKHAWRATIQKTIQRGNKMCVVYRIYGVRKAMKGTQQYPREFSSHIAKLVVLQSRAFNRVVLGLN